METKKIIVDENILVAMQNQIDALSKKMDFIIEEIQYQKKTRKANEDLIEDLTRVGKDVYQTALVELEDVSDSITTGDFWFLIKKLMRNVNNLTKTFELIENAKDFINDFSPISRELVLDLMNKLDELDRKGYFNYLKEFSKMVDNIVNAFSHQDVKDLGDNIVLILNTIKRSTQPEMLKAINNFIDVYRSLDFEVESNVKIMGLIKEMNKDETKRGMKIGINFLKALSKINTNKIGD